MKHFLLAAVLAGFPLLATGQTFSNPVRYSAGSRPYGLAVGDLNNDGYPDAIAAVFDANAAGVLLNKKDGTFAPLVSYRLNPMTGYNRITNAVGDVNNDGFLDIVGSDYRTGTVGVLLNKKNGTFDPAVVYPDYGGYTFMNALADLNRDGYLDLVQGHISGTDLGPRGVSVAFNRKDGTFATPVGYVVGTVPNDLGGFAVGDMNGDGYPDLVLAYQVSKTVAILLNKKDGTFAAALTYPAGTTTPGYIKLGDMNRDGHADVITGSNNEVAVLLNKKDGTLAAATSTAISTSASESVTALAVGDVNGDNYPDVVTGIYVGLDYVVGVLLNNRGTGLTATSTRLSGSFSVNFVELADLNQDRKLDILVLNLGSFSVDVRLNRTTFLAAAGAQASPEATISPNPTAGAATVAVTSLPASVRTLGITFTDALGRLVHTVEHPVAAGEARLTLPTANLAPGVYLVRLTSKDAQGAVISTLPAQRVSVQ